MEGIRREKYIKIYGQILEPKEMTITLMKKTNNRLEIDSKKWNRKLDIEEVLLIDGDKQTSRLVLTISRPTDAYPGGSLAIMLEPSEFSALLEFLLELSSINLPVVLLKNAHYDQLSKKLADTQKKLDNLKLVLAIKLPEIKDLLAEAHENLDKAECEKRLLGYQIASLERQRDVAFHETKRKAQAELNQFKASYANQVNRNQSQSEEIETLQATKETLTEQNKSLKEENVKVNKALHKLLNEINHQKAVCENLKEASKKSNDLASALAYQLRAEAYSKLLKDAFG